MEEAILCHECLRIVREPVVTKCQHAFCRPCADHLVEAGYIQTHSSSVFMCPRCKVKTDLKEGKFEINLELEVTVRIILKTLGTILYAECSCQERRRLV
jgi:hypothetical protein